MFSGEAAPCETETRECEDETEMTFVGLAGCELTRKELGGCHVFSRTSPAATFKTDGTGLEVFTGPNTKLRRATKDSGIYGLVQCKATLRVGDKLKFTAKFTESNTPIELASVYYRLQATAELTLTDPFLPVTENPVATNQSEPKQKLIEGGELAAVNGTELATGQDAVEEPKTKRKRKRKKDLEKRSATESNAAKPTAEGLGEAKEQKSKRRRATEKAVVAQPAEPTELEAASPEPDPKAASRVLRNGLTRQPGDQQKPYKDMQFFWGDKAESALTAQVVACLESGDYLVTVDDARPVRVTLAEMLSRMLSCPNELMLAAQKEVKRLLGKKGASKIRFEVAEPAHYMHMQMLEDGSVVMRTWVRDISDSCEFLKSVDPKTGKLTLSSTGLCHLGSDSHH